MNCALSLALTDAVPPEVPQTAVLSSSQDIDISLIAAAGVFVAVTWGLAALGEPSPQTGTTLTHNWHPPLSLDHFLKEETPTCSEYSIKYSKKSTHGSFTTVLSPFLGIKMRTNFIAS